MGEAIKLSEDMIGKKVKLIKWAGEDECDFAKIGDTGTIVEYDKDDKTKMHYRVSWDSTGEESWMYDEEIEEVNEIEEANEQKIPKMTNKEIWEMLKPKMEKNNVKSKASIINTHIDDYPNNEVEIINAYYESDIINAIATAYRSGYLRAMKGRPFKIGEQKEKKKGGHWVPVDPYNPPKEGTKVRYSRQFNDNGYNTFENRTNMKIGETTVVKYGNFGAFGVKPIHGTREWWCSSSYPDRFDMWVEDDE